MESIFSLLSVVFFFGELENAVRAIDGSGDGRSIAARSIVAISGIVSWQQLAI